MEIYLFCELQFSWYFWKTQCFSMKPNAFIETMNKTMQTHSEPSLFSNAIVRYGLPGELVSWSIVGDARCFGRTESHAGTGMISIDFMIADTICFPIPRQRHVRSTQGIL